MSPIGILTGMEAEARLLTRAARRAPQPPVISCAHADPEAAKALTEDMLQKGAGALMSFGVAGGLDPSLRPGDTVLASRVVHPDGRVFETDKDWSKHLVALAINSGTDIKGGAVAGRDRPVADVDEKRRLAAETGAIAVDMESHIVAEAAFRHGLPLAVIRVVVDPAARALPQTAIEAMTAPSTGGQALSTIAALTKRPGEWLAMIRLGWDMNRAMFGLRRVAGFGLGFFVLDR